MTFNDIFASMIVFFFWFMAIWIFIAVFADIFRRNDLPGLHKAGWILLIFVIPFFGALIYLIARPKMTSQDVQLMAQADAANKAVASVSDRRRDRQAPAAQGCRHAHPGRIRHAEGEGARRLIDRRVRRRTAPVAPG